MARYKIKIDRNTCIGCGGCTNCDNFELDDENKAITKKDDVEEMGCNKEAEEICPVDAITIEEI